MSKALESAAALPVQPPADVVPPKKKQPYPFWLGGAFDRLTCPASITLTIVFDRLISAVSATQVSLRLSPRP